MNFDKIRTMIGFAVKSNKILYGADNIESYRKPIYLIIADQELSDNSLVSLKKIAQVKITKILIVAQKLEDMVHKTNCKVIALLDKNMSDNIIKNAGDGGGNLIG